MSLQNLGPDHPISKLTAKMIDEINMLISGWLDEPDLSLPDTKIAIANALICEASHFSARNWNRPKDEFLNITGYFYDEYQNRAGVKDQ